MPLLPEYVTDESLQQYFVNKDTGEPLANGYIYFYEDDNRNITKPVYELTGAPPNYTYDMLPNPVRTSAVGTPINNAGEDVAIYLRPYDDSGNLQLYYVRVFDENMIEQFTRQARPNISEANNPTDDAGMGVTNELSNPTFSQVLFDSANNLVLTYTGSPVGGTTFNIAPDWQLNIVHTASGTVTVSRQTLTGLTGYQTNPPYTLTISAATNATSVELYQRLNGTPGLWAKYAGSATSNNGWAATSLCLGNGSSAEVVYRPSTGTETTLLNATNNTGAFKEFRNTVQIDPSDNTDSAATGYVDVVLKLPLGVSTVLSSVQVVGMETNEQNVPFDQVPDNRNVDHLFHYYKPQLEYKPIPSHLIGWHFPSNPAQWGEAYAVAAIGANKSDYVWDQTIIFQDTDDGFTASRATTGALKIEIEVNNTQIALVQYLEQDQARDILNDKIAVHIAANKSTGSDVNGLVTLWYTAAALPDMSSGTNNSLVSALAANADVTAGNGTWVQVPRRNGERAAFTLTSSTTENFNDIMLEGWDMAGIAAVGTATNMAIVVSFEDQADGDILDIHSIALCSGSVATRPAPKSPDESLRECERYYEKSYRSSVAVGTTTTENQVIKAQSSYGVNGGQLYFQNAGFGFNYRTVKSSASPNIRIWSPGTGTVANVRCHVWNPAAGADTEADNVLATYWTAVGVDEKSATYTINANLNYSQGATDPVNYQGSGWIAFHYEIDSRIGIA